MLFTIAADAAAIADITIGFNGSSYWLLALARMQGLFPACHTGQFLLGIFTAMRAIMLYASPADARRALCAHMRRVPMIFDYISLRRRRVLVCLTAKQTWCGAILAPAGLRAYASTASSAIGIYIGCY